MAGALRGVNAVKIGCGGCDNTWTGLSMAHCTVCHQTFTAVTGFDLHRRRGQCRKPESIGLVYNPVRRAWSRPAPLRGTNTADDKPFRRSSGGSEKILAQISVLEDAA
jgi:hypothetical protein